jgi:CheY-like chemotaxis protein
MPIMDGRDSTKLIRQFESEQSSTMSRSARIYGRIPILAVSASLVEDLCHEYIDFGFDGWVLKPVDFRRLDFLLRGVYDRTAREEASYGLCKWENGGWLEGSAAKGVIPV